MYKKTSFILGVILALSSILIIIFFLLALKYPEYKLKVNIDNQEQVIDLLKKYYKDIKLQAQIETIERKQLKGEAEIYIHYYKDKKVDVICIDDHEEIGDYIKQHGEKIDLIFELILKFLIFISLTDILLIGGNEIFHIMDKKNKVS